MKKQDMKRARARAKANMRRRNKKKYNRISGKSILSVLVVCFVVSLLLTYGAAADESNEVPVVLKAESVSVIQGEEKPVFVAKATCGGDTQLELDSETGYTVQNLLDELNRGIGYTLGCEADGTKEGEYPINVELTSEIATPLYSEWFGKVRIDTLDGTFEVKNQYGEWDGNKFRRWDESYVKEDFITYQGKTYYFDEKSEKVTGWQEINGSKYYFSKKGVMKTGWMEKGQDKYYFDETGIMHSGWMRLDDEKYYFDQDGIMVTGKLEIGSREYVFAEDGKLESSESDVDPEKPMIALTFDDGPGARTDELLDALEKYDARATFFMLGDKVEKYGDTVRRMMEIGCELGNHSYSHADLTKLEPENVKMQIEVTSDQVAKVAGQRTSVMRPPYGAINETVRENVGMPMILWSIDTLDWKTRNVQATIDTVMENVQDGDIILMHDIHTQSIDAAIQLIPMLQEEGYQLVTVSEMADAREITLENGEKYGRLSKN